MKNILLIVLTFIYILFFNISLFILLSLLSVFFRLVDKTSRKSRRVILFGLKIHSKIFRLDIKKVFSSNKIEKNKNYLLVSNFNNITDIIAILISFDNDNLVPIIRAHNFYIPFFGFFLRSASYIPFYSKKPYQFIRKAVELMKQKETSILHFPTGYNTQIKNYMCIPKNFLYIAKKSNCKILPVKTKISYENNRVKYEINFFDPIDITFYKNDQLILRKIFNTLFR